jgi:MFS family permease
MRAYRRVIAQPVLRRLLPWMAVSALGDGMSMVAVAWLAVQIAPAGREGVWTGLAVAAYSLPATLGAAAFGRFVRGFTGTRLVAIDATLRAVALGTIAVLAVADALAPAGFVALLAVSSLLHAWGNAGTYTLVAELLPDEDRVTGNALVSTFAQASFVIGPALAGGMTALVGPGWVIAADALSFTALATTCWLTALHESPIGAGSGGPPISSLAETTDSSGPREEGTAGGWGIIVRQPRLVGLVAVTCVFFFLYGPVEVALPIHVAAELHGSPGLLGAFWTVFGVGAVVGGLGAGLLRDRPLWAVVVVIIVGWGAALLPVGLTDAVIPGLIGFAAGGVIYGPFTAICTTLFQRACSPNVLSRVLAARSALTTPSTAAGMVLGGPVVTAIGGRETLLASGVLTIVLGVVVAVAVRAARRPRVIKESSHGITGSALTGAASVERVDT